MELADEYDLPFVAKYRPSGFILEIRSEHAQVSDFPPDTFVNVTKMRNGKGFTMSSLDLVRSSPCAQACPFLSRFSSQSRPNPLDWRPFRVQWGQRGLVCHSLINAREENVLTGPYFHLSSVEEDESPHVGHVQSSHDPLGYCCGKPYVAHCGPPSGIV